MMTSILWHSNAPVTLTGYGLQTALFVPKIRDLGYQMTLTAPMSINTAPLDWEGMKIYGCAGDPMGNDILPARASQHHLTITLCDLFGLFQCSQQLANYRVAHWMPVDCDPMGERDIAALRASQGVPLAISKFGYEMIRREGFEPIYVPHGVDTGVFRDTEDRREFREALGVNDDTFVVGIACVNKDGSRKGIDQQMQAFSIFHKRHPDSRLFFHTTTSSHWQLEKIALNLGIHNALIFPDQYSIVSQTITNQSMATWYSALDVLSACSEAEGFGLPILEAQACGTPVVVTNYSSMTELCSSGWLVDYQKHWTGGHESWWVTPNVESIAARYEEAYNQRGNRDYRDRARNFALDYDADLIVANYWKPALAEIEARYAAR